MRNKYIERLEADILQATAEIKQLNKSLTETLAVVERQNKIIQDSRIRKRELPAHPNEF